MGITNFWAIWGIRKSASEKRVLNHARVQRKAKFRAGLERNKIKA
jgi:hypothetical protein